MDELLLFLHGLMKLALVVGLMVLVATAPSAKRAPHARRLSPGHNERRGQRFDDEDDFGRRRSSADLESSWAQSDFEPYVNVDGTPMCSDVDINGNAFGVTEWSSGHDMHSGDNDWMSVDHQTSDWSSDDIGHSASNDDWHSSTDFGCSSSSLFD